MEEFAKRIKQARLERNMSLEQLAKACGLSKSSLQRWEIGECEPKLSAVVALAKFFKVSTDFLAGLED